MENLTKPQIILLTLLVSFVTSIATGIVTVALMNQAPVGEVASQARKFTQSRNGFENMRVNFTKLSAP